MQINKISIGIQKIAKKVSQNDKLYDNVNNIILPIGETVIATSVYAYSIHKSKDIEKERKPALQYQNLICGATGAILANGINTSIQKHQKKIIKTLKDDKTIKNVEGLINGLKIAMPVVVFTSIIRFLIPVVSTPISSKINEINQKNKINKQG